MCKTPKTWSQDEQIQYELARDTISSLASILTRHAARIDDEKKREELIFRAVSLNKETNNFNGFDTEIVKSVINTYAPLIKEYYDSEVSEEDLAVIGLNKKYLTTKVKYDG